MKHLLAKTFSSTVLLVIAGVFLPISFSLAENVPSRTFEIRTYTTTNNELAKLHALFQDKSNRFFIKYGIQVVALWTPRNEPAASNTVVCIFAHSSEEKALNAWKLFNKDPKWNKFAADYGVDTKTLTATSSQFYDPTNYSPIK